MAKSMKFDGLLWDRVVKVSAMAGYSSPEELVQNAVEKELTRLEEAEAADAVERRLRGLGYIE